MLSIPSRGVYFSNFHGGTTPATTQGWVPLREGNVNGHLRPSKVCVLNVPLDCLGTAATKLSDVAARTVPQKCRTPPRFESIAALVGMLLRPSRHLVLEGKEPKHGAGMGNTFDCLGRGQQHRTAVIVEVVTSRPIQNPSASGPQGLEPIALRVWMLVIDPQYSLSRHIGLQTHRALTLQHKALCADVGRPGTAKRKRQQVEAIAAKADDDVPNPADARDRVCTVSDWMAHLALYAGDNDLACGPLETHLLAGNGTPSAIEFLDVLKINTNKAAASSFKTHVAAPDQVLALTAQTLSCGLPNDADPAQLNIARYTAPHTLVTGSREGITFPKPDLCWMLLPPGCVDGFTQPLPGGLCEMIKTAHRRHGSGGEIHSMKPTFERLPKARSSASVEF